MTSKEMKKRLAECGPELTDQQRLEICIEHWELLKVRFVAGVGLPRDNNVGSPCCALCDKYNVNQQCLDVDDICPLGIKGCIPIHRKAVEACDKKSKPAFLAAADEMIAFLESFLEKEDEMLVMKYENDNKDRIRLKQREPLDEYNVVYGVIKAASSHCADINLLAETLHRFNAYGEMVAKVKERKVAMDRDRNWNETYLVRDLLAIARSYWIPNDIKCTILELPDADKK